MACEDKQTAVTEKAQSLAADLSKQSQALGEEYRSRAKDIQPDIDTSGPDAWVGLDFDIVWKRAEFSLDLPQVKIVDQKWALDLPQVTVKNQEIIFSTPSVRMKTVQTGEYPEVTCGWEVHDVGFGIKTKVWSCTTKWSPIYMDVPEPFMQEQRIVLGVPEFRMDRTEFVLGVPEFSMGRQSFSLDLPSIKLKNISVEAKAAEAKGEALAAEAKSRGDELKVNFATTAKQALGPLVTDLFYCYEVDLTKKKNDALAQFEQGVSVLQSVIASLTASKVDETNESLVKARASLAEVLAARETFAKDIEQKFVDLHRQQADFFKQMFPDAAPALAAQ